MASLSILGIAGSVRRPSRTSTLVGEVLGAVGARLDAPTRLIELGDRGTNYFESLSRDGLRGEALAVVEAIESADVLVVGTPVYRASYTGLFKHVFDLVHHETLAGTTVVLTATGGSPLHGLVMEHQLRPLFGFFRAHTVPSVVYATEADFDRYDLTSRQVRERVERAADEAARLVAGDVPLGSRRRVAPVPAIA